MSAKQNRMISTKEVCDRTGLNEATLRLWVRQGKVTAGRTCGGGRYLWSERQYDALVKAIEEDAYTNAYA
jgi:excisionase family DNA binding protein